MEFNGQGVRGLGIGVWSLGRLGFADLGFGGLSWYTLKPYLEIDPIII